MLKKFPLVIKQFNWRMLLMRIVMYTVLLVVVVLLTPKVYFGDRRFIAILLTAITFGVISAVIRPIIQFFTLPFIFATYGLVVVFINIVILMVLSWLSGGILVVSGVIPAIIGGALIGLLGGFLESLFGLNAPIIPESDEEVRKRVKFQDRGLVYALFQAAPAELQKFAPLPDRLAEPLPATPDTQDAEAILATLDAGAHGPPQDEATSEASAAAADKPPPETAEPPPNRRSSGKTSSAPEETE
jgi:putative membrane protein